MSSCFYEKNHGRKMEKRTVPHLHEDKYWSVVENRRVCGGGVVQRQVLYLGELNDNQRAGWVRTIEAFSDEKSKAKQMALFPDDREELPILACEVIRVQLDKIELRRPREWGNVLDTAGTNVRIAFRWLWH